MLRPRRRSYDRLGELQRPTAAVRISDADRAAAAERLRIAVDEGRLSSPDTPAACGLHRHHIRRARADRRPAGRAGGEAPAAKASAAAVERRKWLNEWREWMGGAIIMIAIWGTTSLVNGSLHPFWPAIPIGIWAAVLVAGALGKKEKDT